MPFFSSLPAAAPGHATPAQRNEQCHIEAQLLRMAYQRLPMSLVMTAAVIVAFSGLFAPQFGWAPMGLWAGTMVVVVAVRWIDQRGFVGAGHAAAYSPAWAARLVAGAALAGLAWATGPLTMIREPGQAAVYLLALTLLAVSAVSMASLMAHRTAMFAFQVSALLPTGGALIATGGSTEILAGLIVLAGLIMLMAVGSGSHRAVRAQLEAERGLARSERNLLNLVANLPGVVYSVDPGSELPRFVSEEARQATGHPAESFVNGQQRFDRLMDPAEADSAAQQRALALREHRRYELRYPYRHADGSWRWAAEYGQGAYDDQGQLLSIDGMIFDRTADVQADIELARTRQQLFDALEALDVGVLMLDADDRVILCNQVYRDVSAPNVQALSPGERLEDVLRSEYRHGMAGTEAADEQAWVEQRLEEHATLSHGPRVRQLRANGRWYRCDDSRTPAGVTISLRTDVTEQVANLHEIQRARDQAEAASRAKSHFLANMSHELRTPLNAVIGAAQLLEADADDAQQRAYLTDAIQRSGTNLLGLIENVLDISRIEAGELKLQMGDFHVLECVDAALFTAGLAARAKGLQLACIAAPGLAAWRFGDEARVRQIVLNLMGNAIKFTDRGDIVLSIDGDDRQIKISVSDTGIGIDPQALSTIFEPFRQADEGADRRYGGSGLGLAIVHEVVRAMGGTISVESRKGSGTRFDVQLPLRPVAAPAREPVPEPADVAFYEPHEPSARALVALLERLGLAPQRCASPDELRRWSSAPARAADAWLLVDADTVSLDDWVRTFGSSARAGHLVPMSSRESHVARPSDAVPLPRPLLKPLSRTAMVSRLVRSTSVDTTSTLAKPSVACGGANASAHVLVVEDDALNRAIVSRLLGHAGYRVSSVPDGATAVKMLADSVLAPHTTIDLILMDWQMPDMDGGEATRRIRAGAAGAGTDRVPIVALTANAFAEDRATCLAAGMNDFLTKPVNAQALARCIARWVPLRPTAATAGPDVTAPPMAAAQAGSPAQAAEVFDPAVLAALPMVADGSDPGYAGEVLTMFIESVPDTLAALDRAHEAQDRVTMQRLAHTLKSGAASVGALALAQQSAELEAELRAGRWPPAAAIGQLRHEFERLQFQLAVPQADLVPGALVS